MKNEPVFLILDQALRIHARMIELCCGAAGVRDMGLLESALAQPKASFGGEYLLQDLPAIAAAYLFGITKNHPFIDGNKRAGLGAAAVFLELNGYEL